MMTSAACTNRVEVETYGNSRDPTTSIYYIGALRRKNARSKNEVSKEGYISNYRTSWLTTSDRGLAGKGKGGPSDRRKSVYKL